MKFEAVVFDLDGTLVDTLRDIGESANFMLGQLGLPTHPIAAYRKKVGDGVRKLVQRALPQNRADLLDKALEIHCGYFHEHLIVHSQPYAGILEILAALEKSSIPLAVLSNKPDTLTRQVCRHFFGTNTFTQVMGHREEMPLKPDPTSAQALALELGVDPTRMAYVGDTSVDMQTANRAGMFAIGVTWGFRDREELESYGSDIVIDQPSELLTII
jgi:phosphoglycolate phosphatase